MIKLPQLNIYKGSGAMKWRLVPPELNPSDGSYPVPGCIFLEMCKSTGQKDRFNNPTYSWVEEKITMKLSDKDIAAIIIGLTEGKASIIHDPGAGTENKGGTKKTLNVEPGQNPGTWFLTMRYGEKQARVPIDTNERLRLGLLLKAAIPAIFGWC